LQLDGDDLLLLPRRIVAYALRERKFVMLDVQSTRQAPEPQNVFRDLKINPTHKRMVKSVVKNHFQKQQLQKARPHASLNQDLIRGKGSGLVILLHGVPGVGKTATAEAVAQANRKPLFVITCGDLGFTPKAVETSLRDIFRLAHLWDCVLLLDEADIFLSRRAVSDLKRNALVSVFLRVLEYYSGILFLTTNRVGALDEAFKSRIQLHLYYPRLNLPQTTAIFEVNIQKLLLIEQEKEKQRQDQDNDHVQEPGSRDSQAEARAKVTRPPAIKIDQDAIRRFAHHHFKTHNEEQRWNGRQIRNAFQIAYSLANFEMERSSLDVWDEGEASTPHTPATLNERQFEDVAAAIENFDEYLFDAMKANHGEIAELENLRADNHTPKNIRRKPPPPRPEFSQPPRSGLARSRGPARQPGRPAEYQDELVTPQHKRTPQRGNNHARSSPSQVSLRPKIPPDRRREDSGYSSLHVASPGDIVSAMEDDYPEEDNWKDQGSAGGNSYRYSQRHSQGYDQEDGEEYNREYHEEYNQEDNEY
jgi:hypothetical protein